jgi:negative regulator of genetic competence, sporulation and motility
MQVVGSPVRENHPMLGGSMLPWETSVSLLVTARYDDDEDDLDDFEEDEELDEEMDGDEDDDEESYEDYDDLEDDLDEDDEPRHGRRRNEWE